MHCYVYAKKLKGQIGLGLFVCQTIYSPPSSPQKFFGGGGGIWILYEKNSFTLAPSSLPAPSTPPPPPLPPLKKKNFKFGFIVKIIHLLKPPPQPTNPPPLFPPCIWIYEYWIYLLWDTQSSRACLLYKWALFYATEHKIITALYLFRK